MWGETYLCISPEVKNILLEFRDPTGISGAGTSMEGHDCAEEDTTLEVLL